MDCQNKGGNVKLFMGYDQGIILLSFGTTYEETRKKNIHALTDLVKSAYPDLTILEAFSSGRVRKVLKERDGICIPDLSEAMKEMKNLGVRKLYICPTHILGGLEYEKCKALAEEKRHLFEEMSFGEPLLGSEEDYLAVAKAFWDGFCETEEYIVAEKEEPWNVAYVFMGHGTSHQADRSYELLETELRKYSGQEVYIATVEGAVRIEDVIRKLESGQIKKVFLAPFMLVAGDHAVNDMAGEEDSFAAKLKSHGFDPVCVIRGIGEYPQMQRVYLEKIRKQMK